jgi:hypothetical protein
MRRPAGLATPEFERKLAQALEALRHEYGPIEEEPKGHDMGEAHIADTSGALVRALLEVTLRLDALKDAG